MQTDDTSLTDFEKNTNASMEISRNIR